MSAIDHSFLKQLLSEPTAPFRETCVKRRLNAYFKENRIPHFDDPVGNIVVGVSSEAEYKARLSQTSRPLFVFMAHMDHPGFHITSKKGKHYEAKWHGGGPKKGHVGAKVWIADTNGYCGTGKIVQVKLNPTKTAVETLKLDLKLEKEGDPTELFGGYGFKKPIWEQSGRYFTKAADDLVGCFLISQLAREFSSQDHFIGVLTRAEEVGFIGAIAHMELGWASGKRPCIGISLETSRTLPGALIGAGPVVRLGDRMTTFDPAGSHWLHGLAQKNLKKFQRRIMDGGSCEGTVFTAWGWRALGISVPLGNYHNENLEGGPGAKTKGGPAPEFVHKEDIAGAWMLCQSILQGQFQPDQAWDELKTSLKARLTKMEAMLI